MSLTVKTDDVTKGRKDLDPHGRLRGEWVKESVKDRKLDKRSMHFFAFGDDSDVIV